MLFTNYTTRRQIFITATGGYNVLKIMENDIPTPGSNEVLVEVRSAGLNFFDNYIRHGLGLNAEPPCVIGLECAGIVRYTGKDVNRVKYGDHVVVHCPHGGAFSDFVVVNQMRVLCIPDDINFDAAAAVTVNYLTAYLTLIVLGGLQSGNTVLVQSAAGGVGWAATQISKLCKNVKVIGVASEEKHEEIMKNGVDYAFTYDQISKEKILEISPGGVSIVLENLAGESFTKNQEILAPLGKIILIGAKNMVCGEKRNFFKVLSTWWNTKNVSPYDLIMENRSVAGFHLNNVLEKSSQTFQDAWVKVVNYLSSGKIQPRIDSVYAFTDIEDACRRIAERKNIGKVILRPHLETKEKTIAN